MKIIAIILCLTFSGLAYGEDMVLWDADFGYELTGKADDAGGAAVITQYRGTSASITIPMRLDDLPVIRVGDGAFRRKELTGVSGFPPIIGKYAFADNNITSLVFEDGVSYIEEGAFAGNPLVKITIGTNVEIARTAVDNRFIAFYQNNEQQAGVYIFRENRWYTERAWAAIEEERKRLELELAQHEEIRSDVPLYQFSLNLINKFQVYNDVKSNWIIANPWYSLQIRNNMRLFLSGKLYLPWDEADGWKQPEVELDVSSFLYNWSGGKLPDFSVEAGRLYYMDPLGLIAEGIFDGIKLSLFTLSLEAYYTGFVNKKTANIMMSAQDFLDYGNKEIRFAPKRLFNSLQWQVMGDYGNHLILGGLVQFGLRDDPHDLNSQYAMAKIHISNDMVAMDIGASAGFMQEGKNPHESGFAGAFDITWGSLNSNIRFLLGLWWFSGAINENTSPFIPVTSTHYSPRWAPHDGKPSLWLPRLSFYLGINEMVSLDVHGWYYIWEDDNFADAPWKVDVGLTVSPPSLPLSPSAANQSPANSGIGWHIPLFIGVYGEGFAPNYFSLGFPMQLGVEIDFNRYVSFALIGEAAAGLGYPNLLEGNIGGIAELYLAGKKIGFGIGVGIYGSMLNMPEISSGSSSGAIDLGNLDGYPVRNVNYVRYALLFQNRYKLSFFVQQNSDATFGGGLIWAVNLLK